MGSPESSDSDVEFADPTHPESELVPDILSKKAHAKLDKKVLRRYPRIDNDEKDDHSIYSRHGVTLTSRLPGITTSWANDTPLQGRIHIPP